MRFNGLAVTLEVSQSKGRELESRCGQEFFVCDYRFRYLQLEEAHANVINHDTHLSQYPVLDKGSVVVYHCSC